MRMNGKDLCSRCAENSPARNSRYCLTCKALYMRDYRKAKPVSELERKKKRARDYTRYQVRIGKVVKASICWLCGGGEAMQAHHLDYSRPELVEWICRKCHQGLHRRKRKDAEAVEWERVTRRLLS